MDRAAITRNTLKALAGILGVGVVILAGVLIFIAVADASTLRGFVIRHFTARTGRAMQIDGAIQVHLFQRHPQLTAERVTIGNPPWTQPGRTAEIGELKVALNLPTLTRPFGIRRIELSAATLHLARDEAGRANWQWTEPGKPEGKAPPFLHSLSMPNAHVTLEDARR
ncbi:MAG: AsmA family protein, partial [Gammaproteobacteria bacterium]